MYIYIYVCIHTHTTVSKFIQKSSKVLAVFVGPSTLFRPTALLGLVQEELCNDAQVPYLIS